jgi:hypothetical protein
LVPGLLSFADLLESLKTSEEKFKDAGKLIADTLGSFLTDVQVDAVLNLSSDELSDWMKSIDLSSTKHIELAAALGDIAPAMAVYLEGLREQGTVIGDIGEAFANQNLVVRELELLGKAEEALALSREIEIAGLGALDAEITKRIWALEDEATAAAAAAAAQEELQNQIQSYVDALTNIQRQLDSTRQGIEEFGMDPKAIYERRKEEADVLMDALGQMTDPKMIQDTVSQINKLIGEGWGVLDEGQKKILQKDFLAYLDDIEALSEERLAVGLAPLLPGAEISLEGAVAEFATVMENLDGSLASSSEGFEHSSAEMRTAAREMVGAASQMTAAARAIPSTLSVRVHDREVS